VERTVDFGASDDPLASDKLAKDGLIQFPTVVGGITPVVNIAGVKAGELRLDQAAHCGIFLGEIKFWDDAKIKTLNPKLNLPHNEITVVHRSDGSGTTYIWVDYLAKTSPEFKSKVGVATSVNWPAGVGGKGNEGVAGLVTQTPGSIGYVELIFALQNKTSYGAVQNMAGEFVKASVESVTAAASAAAKQMPADFRVSITNAPGAGVYPISSFTWLLLYENPKDKNASKTMVDFLKWALSDGQKFAGSLGYAPLPPEVVKLELAALERVKTQ
jgi:phosphate transport system substrate-binding protein